MWRWPLSAQRAAWARRPSRSTWRPRWRGIVPGSTLLLDLHVANGDAAVFLGAEPRFSIVDALENTHRLDEAFFRNLIVKTKAGVDLLASSDRVMTTPLDVRRIRTLLEMAGAPLPLRRARRPPFGRRRPRRARGRQADRHRRQPGAGDGSQRQPHGRDAAPAAREGQADVWCSADRIASRRSVTKTWNAPLASR